MWCSCFWFGTLIPPFAFLLLPLLTCLAQVPHTPLTHPNITHSHTHNLSKTTFPYMIYSHTTCQLAHIQLVHTQLIHTHTLCLHTSCPPTSYSYRRHIHTYSHTTYTHIHTTYSHTTYPTLSVHTHTTFSDANCS